MYSLPLTYQTSEILDFSHSFSGSKHNVLQHSDFTKEEAGAQGMKVTSLKGCR